MCHFQCILKPCHRVTPTPHHWFSDIVNKKTKLVSHLVNCLVCFLSSILVSAYFTANYYLHIGALNILIFYIYSLEFPPLSQLNRQNNKKNHPYFVKVRVSGVFFHLYWSSNVLFNCVIPFRSLFD